MSESMVSIQLTQRKDYQFDVVFGDAVPPMLADEPAPLGGGLGPSPVQLLAAAVGNCLSDSLLFSMRKFKQSPEPLACSVTAEVGRNGEGRLRVLGIHAEIRLGVPASQLQHVERIVGQFESYCTVSQSVAQGIPIQVSVFDSAQVRLK
jgi:uncharacterized OsmC-like protein